jgi:DnaJ family protein A protein 2
MVRGTTGDLVITIKQVPHATVTRAANGADLMTTKRVSLKVALCGGRVSLRHLDGQLMLMVFAVQAGELSKGPVWRAVVGRGLPGKGGGPSGKFFVKLEMDYPSPGSLTPQLAKALRETFPPRDEAAGIDADDEECTTVVMEDSDLKSFQSAASGREETGGREAYGAGDEEEEDEDDIPRHFRGRQCNPM